MNKEIGIDEEFMKSFKEATEVVKKLKTIYLTKVYPLNNMHTFEIDRVGEIFKISVYDPNKGEFVKYDGVDPFSGREIPSVEMSRPIVDNTLSSILTVFNIGGELLDDLNTLLNDDSISDKRVSVVCVCDETDTEKRSLELDGSFNLVYPLLSNKGGETHDIASVMTRLNRQLSDIYDYNKRVHNNSSTLDAAESDIMVESVLHVSEHEDGLMIYRYNLITGESFTYCDDCDEFEKMENGPSEFAVNELIKMTTNWLMELRTNNEDGFVHGRYELGLYEYNESMAMVPYPIKPTPELIMTTMYNFMRSYHKKHDYEDEVIYN